jgi:hypothetical protein
LTESSGRVKAWFWWTHLHRMQLSPRACPWVSNTQNHSSPYCKSPSVLESSYSSHVCSSVALLQLLLQAKFGIRYTISVHVCNAGVDHNV